MADLDYPTAWLRIDEASIALGMGGERTMALAKIYRWRSTRDLKGFHVYALEDVRSTAKLLRLKPTPDSPPMTARPEGFVGGRGVDGKTPPDPHRGIALLLDKIFHPKRSTP